MNIFNITSECQKTKNECLQKTENGVWEKSLSMRCYPRPPWSFNQRPPEFYLKPPDFIGDSQIFVGHQDFIGDPNEKQWGLQCKSGISDEKVGVFNENLGISNKNLGVFVKNLGVPLQ